jgi:hypothetical protein
MHWAIKTAIVAASVVVGLAVIGSLHQEAAATAPGAPTTTAPRVIDSDTRLIREGQFYIMSFSVSRPAKITVSVKLKDGPPIDSYFVGEQGLNTWQAMAANGQSIGFRYRADLSMAPLSDGYSHTGLVQPGTYAVIIDNSRLGATAPPFHFFKKSPALVAYTISIDET